MQQETWTRVRALFERALDLEAVEREGWVKSQCGGDAGLVAAVLALLHSDAVAEVPVLDTGASTWARIDDFTGTDAGRPHAEIDDDEA